MTLLCPYMKFVQIKQLNMNIELFLRMLLKGIYNNNFCYIRSLCFHIPAADDLMIDNLKQMIKDEQLLFQFAIERIIDNIYLKWT
ncbi:unnamed protein product [Rotaria sordida]|uniref:Uncharacterized protein n=1 Tax=Rotaria sordida TaxID=392033 RepID=A0A814UEW5_9BILA|nr:unnamed protein product [Rotaria sordida]CAF3975168.1 unnamed protein product [Rotaria sordida]